jgi:hypothetical protein
MERFNVEIEDIYFDGYCQYKECYGGVEMNVSDSNAGAVIAEISDEECFMFSGYKQQVWMSDLDPVVKDLMDQVLGSVELTEDEFNGLELDIKFKLKTAINARAIGEWYSEPDYISGWDDIEIEA